MRRGQFLRRALIGIVALAGVKAAPAASAPSIPVIRMPEADMDAIRVVSLVSSGGICCPMAPYYNIPELATAAHPVRDSLPAFQAKRGLEQ